MAKTAPRQMKGCVPGMLFEAVTDIENQAKACIYLSEFKAGFTCISSEGIEQWILWENDRVMWKP